MIPPPTCLWNSGRNLSTVFLQKFGTSCNGKTFLSTKSGENWCHKQGELRPCEAMPEVDKMLNRLDDKGPDESFLHFLDRCCAQAGSDSKKWALSYVSGFHAADPALISVHSLVSGMRADEQVEGDRAFHLNLGYEGLVNVFRRQLDGSGVPIHLQTVIENIEWSSPEVRVTVRSG